MLDFIVTKVTQKSKNSKNEGKDTGFLIYPEFLVKPSEDLMVKGQSFYAVWDEKEKMWSRDIETARRLIDEALLEKRNQYPQDIPVTVLYLKNYSTKKWQEFLSYIKSLPDSFKELDSCITFADTVVTKSDYASRRLNYNMKQESTEAYDELISTLYDPIERQKIEWAIGSVFSGDSKYIEKMLVFYGQPGTGKGSILKIIQQLFQSYSGIFTSQLLCGKTVGFALEMFKNNPLISIDFDGKLSNIEDNTSIDKIISHETLTVDSKHKSLYDDCFKTMLFVGTNNPVKITDSKSGIVRRLIDVHPSNETIPFSRYQVLKAQVKFELGGIAYHCLQVYNSLGIDAYSRYIPIAMLGATNHFYNFVEDNYERFSKEDCITLKEAWLMYQEYAAAAQVRYPYDMSRVADDLKGYFKHYYERKRLPSGSYKRKIYSGFMKEKFTYGYLEKNNAPVSPVVSIEMNSAKSLLDEELKDCKAQYFTGKEDHPLAQKWSDVSTKLEMIDTKQQHYVLPPKNHIVIDFDLKNADGEKDIDLNLEAASKWPSTYSEISKSGSGIHLHYIYEGDASRLSPQYDNDIDILSFATGKTLRRQLTKCNDVPIATLSSGLPEKKGESKVIGFEGLKNEKALRTSIERNLRKEIHPSTKSSMDFIFKILTDFYNTGKPYDVSDLRQQILTFASNSTNQSLYCIKLVNKMPFKSESEEHQEEWDTDALTFFDLEVYPNLLIITHKQPGFDVVKMINPGPAETAELIKNKLVGFNNRRYDNHILYARMLGYSNEELYHLSKKLIGSNKHKGDINNGTFRNAYNLSYTDIYDYCSNPEKKSLKKWQVELGIHHVEMSIPWDDPVPENLWLTVADYCANDTISTEAVFNATKGSWAARLILAELSGLTPNDTTNAHSMQIIFGSDRHPQSQFNYPDLSETFPGYKYEFGVSTYMNETVSEGGQVYAEPGMYLNAPELDAESMHPSSIIAMNLFGDKYTERYKSLKDIRICIKHRNYEEARKMFGGKLNKYLKDDKYADDLASALKTVINSVYGLTKASFDNRCRDPRNIDNVVAKRGALFMITLKNEVQARGYTVAHIKTDSIKIPEADDEIVEFVKKFGEKYGYRFKVESDTPYKKFCLVNKSTYIAQDVDGNWTSKGEQFSVPYVFKTLFTKEEVSIDDLVIVKNVTSPAYMVLDFDESKPMGEHDYQFVGKAGAFLPIKTGHGGGILLRETKLERRPQENESLVGEEEIVKHDSVGGTKNHRWIESDMVVSLHKEEFIDMSYYIDLANEAKKTIEQFTDFEEFIK